MIERIISGGQTGADRGALDAAIKAPGIQLDVEALVTLMVRALQDTANVG